MPQVFEQSLFLFKKKGGKTERRKSVDQGAEIFNENIGFLNPVRAWFRTISNHKYTWQLVRGLFQKEGPKKIDHTYWQKNKFESAAGVHGRRDDLNWKRLSWNRQLSWKLRQVGAVRRSLATLSVRGLTDWLPDVFQGKTKIENERPPRPALAQDGTLASWHCILEPGKKSMPRNAIFFLLAVLSATLCACVDARFEHFFFESCFYQKLHTFSQSLNFKQGSQVNSFPGRAAASLAASSEPFRFLFCGN